MMVDTLPVDILYNIIAFLNVVDIIHLRQVSQRLFQVTQHRAVWHDAYSQSALPRPPGPFTWQSTQQLEYGLITTAKVERNWPPQVASPITSHKVTLAAGGRQFYLVFGRWILAGGRNEVLCYDLDARGGEVNPTRVHFAASGADIQHFRCLETTSPGGEPLAFALIWERRKSSEESLGPSDVIKVFKFSSLPDPNIPSNSTSSVELSLVREINLESMPLDEVFIGPRLLVIHAKGYTPGSDRMVIMNTESYHLYSLPAPHHLSEGMHPPTFAVHSRVHISTDYILTSHPSRSYNGDGSWTSQNFIKAYPIPPTHEPMAQPEPLLLRSTHQGVFFTAELTQGPTLWEWRNLETGETQIALGVNESYRIDPNRNELYTNLTVANITLSHSEGPSAIRCRIEHHDAIPDFTLSDTIRPPPLRLVGNNGEAHGRFVTLLRTTSGRTISFEVFGFILRLKVNRESSTVEVGGDMRKLDLPPLPQYGPPLVIGFHDPRGRLCWRYTNNLCGVAPYIEVLDFA
ncbi:hypothetical protein BV22DRAFT_1199714 [Leucogyrophana mollusca]|uniref:Uncharacterized protein n=1 Tax=Leucogyrophana mollusca TaxID=85980 RepID=A0ACB8AZT4_9AGAM|nr:hypothetical protein BV22DRAFT_1199714 [Leucogyrophana mollusca]